MDEAEIDRLLKPVREYPTDPEVFERLARSVLGEDWIARLARAVRVNLRTAQRWAVAGRIISPQAWEWLYEQERALKVSGFKGRLIDAQERAEHHGVSAHSIVGLLRDQADHVVQLERMRAKREG